MSEIHPTTAHADLADGYNNQTITTQQPYNNHTTTVQQPFNRPCNNHTTTSQNPIQNPQNVPKDPKGGAGASFKHGPRQEFLLRDAQSYAAVNST